MAISTQTVYNVWAAGIQPRQYKEVTIDASQTIVPGTVIGQKTIAAGTAVVGGSNTGDGLLTAFALAAGGPAKIGTYVLTCVEAVTNSGVFHLVDPDGLMIAQVTVPVSGDVTVVSGGITFNIADGATDFVLDDTFDLPVEAGTGYGIVLDIAATDGSQKWQGVAVEEITTGAAESQKTVIAITGDFHSQGLVFGGSTVYGDVIDEARDAGCFIHVSYSDENTEVV